jgi:predicted XRE-type DNA-binding protein
MKPIKAVDDMTMTPSSGDVFFDLGFDPAEARIKSMRIEILVSLQQFLEAQPWTQAEIAERLGVTQPRVSKLMKGAARDFSIDMLLLFAARLGLKPELRLAA